MDERKAYRDRVDALLDKLAEVTKECAEQRMRAELAEEREAFAASELINCREGRE